MRTTDGACTSAVKGLALIMLIEVWLVQSLGAFSSSLLKDSDALSSKEGNLCGVARFPNAVTSFATKTQVISKEWSNFHWDTRLNDAPAFTFWSREPDCNVELKFTRASIPVTIAFFPNGLDDVSTFFFGTHGALADCSFDQDAMVLGESIFSESGEVGFSFVGTAQEVTNTSVAASSFTNFTIKFRLHCSDDNYLLGLPLEAVSSRTFLDLQTFNTGARYYKGKECDMIFSISPPLVSRQPCIVRVHVQQLNASAEIYDGTASKELALISGPTYASRFNETLTVRYQSGGSPYAQLVFDYTADCSGYERSSDIKLGSWQFHELGVPNSEWTTARITVIDNDTHAWFFPPEVTSSDVMVKAIDLERDGFISQSPREYGIKDRPVVIIGRQESRVGPSILTFRYRCISSSITRIELDSPRDRTRIIFNSESLPSSRLQLQTLRDGCIISVTMVLEEEESYYSSHLFPWVPHLFGYDQDLRHEQRSDVSDGRRIKGRAQAMQSYGGNFGLSLSFPDLVTDENHLTLDAEILCAQALSVNQIPNQWRKVVLESFSVWTIPPMKGCKTELAVLSSTLNVDWDFILIGDDYNWEKPILGVRATCARKSTARLFRMVPYLTTCSKPLLLQPLDTMVELAYRSVCPTKGSQTSISSSLPPQGIVLIAGNKLQSFHDLTGKKTIHSPAMIRTWTIKARDPSCSVQIRFKRIQTSAIAVFEDFSVDPKFQRQATMADLSESYMSDVEYTSCKNRVYVQGKRIRWDDYAEYEAGEELFMASYKQVCPPRRRGKQSKSDRIKQSKSKCGGLDVRLQATWKWQTLKFESGINFNQVDQTTFFFESSRRALVGGASSMDNVWLELEFMSVVQQSWYGRHWGYSGGAEYLESTNQLRGVHVNDAKWSHAALGAGQFYSLVTPVRIWSDVMMKKKGDHIFTVRYRLRDRSTNIALVTRSEFEPQVLIATNEIQQLNFTIPNQFSDSERERIIKQDLVMGLEDYEGYYEEVITGGHLNYWVFRYRWLLQAKSTGCRVLLTFAKMDIGCGYLKGKQEHYQQAQHRLAIADGETYDVHATLGAQKEFLCSSIEDRPGVDEYEQQLDRPARPKCARLDTIYLSGNASLGILFQSTDLVWDDAAPHGYSTFVFEQGAETTWGSGWTATYKQVCSEREIDEEYSKVKPIRVFATQQRSSSSGLPTYPNNTETQLFLNRSWEIVPKTLDCSVQFAVVQFGKNAYLRDENNQVAVEHAYSKPTGTSRNLTFTLFGLTRSERFTFDFWETCPPS